MGGIISKRIFLCAFLMFVMMIGSFVAVPLAEASEIQDRTDDSALRVEFSQQSRSSSGTISRNRSPQPQARANPVVRAPSSTPTTFSGTSRQSAASDESEPVCMNRSEIFSAMIENRECDPSIPAAVSPNPRPQQPVPVANNQPQVVVEPVEIVITASDLLELIPSSPQILMDRGPFGLKNAHTNFYASNHRPQTVTRTMFDQQVTITATPIEYRWDYGDGNTFTTELPGHPVDVFNTATDTSHQYTETGLYTVNMTTVFEGTYQVDGGETQMVSSTVTQQADPVEIRIWRAVTRNVDQTCLQNPKAWGC